jgi:hypothetical protein
MTTRSSSFERALNDLRDALKKSLSEVETRVARTAEDVKVRVEERKRLAEALTLNERLYAIFCDVRFYPSWITNHPESVCDLVTNVNVTETGDHVDVVFAFRERRYALNWESHWSSAPVDQPTRYADLKLCDDSGAVLYAAWLSSQWDETGYHSIGVKAFVPAGWIEDVIELSERVSTLKRSASLRWEEQRLEQERQNFGLDQGDGELQRVAKHLAVSVGNVGSSDNPSRAAGRRVGAWLRRLL